MQIPRGITQKPNGKFSIQTMLRGERLNGTADTLEEAIVIKKRMKAGTYSVDDAATAITLSDALTAYIQRRVSTSTSDKTSAQTFEWYRKTMVNFFGASTKLDNISEARVNLFQDHMTNNDWANTTINYVGSLLYGAMSDAHQRGQMKTPPTRMKSLKAENGRIRFLTLEEEARVVDWFEQNNHDDYRDLVLFYIETGLRKSEALELKWSDLDLHQKRITIWKTKSNFPRSVSITPMVLEILQRLQRRQHNLPRHDQRVFGHISERHFGRSWVAMREGLGLQDDTQFVVHALRHTCCTRLVSAGTDLRTVMEWMGHASLEITQRYSHFIPKRMDTAVSRLVSLRVKQ
jgi:integrase